MECCIAMSMCYVAANAKKMQSILQGGASPDVFSVHSWVEIGMNICWVN